jgi:hypothetical protein
MASRPQDAVVGTVGLTVLSLPGCPNAPAHSPTVKQIQAVLADAA